MYCSLLSIFFGIILDGFMVVVSFLFFQVTGGNKGIGYAIVKGLCQKYLGKVYLTSRDVERGQEAVKKLKDLGLNPSYHQLDIDSESSVNDFKEYISKKYGSIDILINNAAMAFKVCIILEASS